MLALVAAHMSGGLHLWEHGRKQTVTAFTAESLETEYRSFLKLIDNQRILAPDAMHRTMHALYRAVMKSRDTTVLEEHGSASDILTLAPEPALAAA
uniref:Gfo/Idh/MocA-like oxidoreductase C-terminal domain-containing protein n=1 Tax=Mycena chlorophos TaxID=658473 RepID=A0ABQ0L215_MYCCL|nr:predicted protein [Mycena chlorophos]